MDIGDALFLLRNIPSHKLLSFFSLNLSTSPYTHIIDALDLFSVCVQSFEYPALTRIDGLTILCNRMVSEHDVLADELPTSSSSLGTHS